MSTGFSAVEKVESCWVHDILLGMLECFEVDLKTDQNFLLFDFSKDGSFWKYSLRLVLTNVLAARRRSRNFSQRLADEESFAFFLIYVHDCVLHFRVQCIGS
jgi:hypothetical protein